MDGGWRCKIVVEVKSFGVNLVLLQIVAVLKILLVGEERGSEPSEPVNSVIRARVRVTVGE